MKGIVSHLYTLLEGSVAFFANRTNLCDHSFGPNPLQLNPGYAIVWDYLFLDTEVVIKAIILLYLDLVSFPIKYPIHYFTIKTPVRVHL